MRGYWDLCVFGRVYGLLEAIMRGKWNLCGFGLIAEEKRSLRSVFTG